MQTDWKRQTHILVTPAKLEDSLSLSLWLLVDEKFRFSLTDKIHESIVRAGLDLFFLLLFQLMIVYV